MSDSTDFPGGGLFSTWQGFQRGDGRVQALVAERRRLRPLLACLSLALLYRRAFEPLGFRGLGDYVRDRGICSSAFEPFRHFSRRPARWTMHPRGEAVAREARSRQSLEDPYARLRTLDGTHALQHATPAAYVPYRARRRRGGRIVFFNFPLAREMGLLPPSHPDTLSPALARALLDTFSLTIINEWDLARGTRIPARDRLPGTYMATRYLQLQHPDRSGRTSGDGRSVWNGSVTHRGVTWDVSSQGTGVTRLCPATATEKRFFKTGNRYASYGCGTAALAEGLSTLLMSETFHRNGIPTERALAVIGFPGGFSINVRAARSLLRPSHFFVHLKQGRREALEACVSLFIDRQISNGDWPRIEGRARRLRFFAAQTARNFARTAALFESEYVFCWLDWDGDNILADGGIIDYGSVRQFGLCHREYRFEDVDRMSTSLPEQRRKARHIVQNFAQIRDFLLGGTKRPLASFRSDPILALFDQEFERTHDLLLLRKVGLEPALAERVVRLEPERVRRLRRTHAWFERARSSRGRIRVADGLSWNAVYCTRDLFRELPARLRAEPAGAAADEILSVALSRYASRRDRRSTPHRRRKARELGAAHREVLEAAARHSGCDLSALLPRVAERAAILNRAERITGDAIDFATARLMRARHRLASRELHELVERFVDEQDLTPGRGARRIRSTSSPRVARVLGGLLRVVRENREGL